MIKSKIVNKDGSNYLITLEIYNTNNIDKIEELFIENNYYINNNIYILNYLSESSENEGFASKAKKVIRNIIEAIKKLVQTISRAIRAFTIKIRNKIRSITGKEPIEEVLYIDFDLRTLEDDMMLYCKSIKDHYKFDDRYYASDNCGLIFDNYVTERKDTSEHVLKYYDKKSKELEKVVNNINNKVNSLAKEIQTYHDKTIEEDPTGTILMTQKVNYHIVCLNGSLSIFNKITKSIASIMGKSIYTIDEVSLLVNKPWEDLKRENEELVKNLCERLDRIKEYFDKEREENEKYWDAKMEELNRQEKLLRKQMRDTYPYKKLDFKPIETKSFRFKMTK